MLEFEPDFERRSSFGDAGWTDHTVADVQGHLRVHADIPIRRDGVRRHTWSRPSAPTKWASSNKKQADFFLWKDPKYPEDACKPWFGRRKPCIKGSDSHNVNDEIGRLKDHNSDPVDKYCWIKADPTFGGLRQITNEPESRVYIGSLPPKLQGVQGNTTRYLASASIRRHKGNDPDHVWFDINIPLSLDMVAIIGNKGSGKSALADIVALAGNTHCDAKYFSFLTKERFCGCLRCLLLVMCTYPFAKKALTLHLARGEGRERYFGCNLTQRKVLASSHQHLMAEAPAQDGVVLPTRKFS